MSEEAVAQFLGLVAVEQALAEAMDAVAGEKADIASTAVKLGKKRGLEFTGKEFISAIEAFYREHPGELDEAELDGVSGGFNPQPEPPGGIGPYTNPPWFSRSWATKFRGRR